MFNLLIYFDLQKSIQIEREMPNSATIRATSSKSSWNQIVS